MPAPSNRTARIRLDTRLCRACWKCVEACPRGVMGKIDLFFHRHAKIKRPGECTGCLRCVRICPHGAIQAAARKDAPKTSASN